ncbi:MAG TPA: hypothetical protein VH020_15785, partial [Stellaceae bacterium]|nr:hypothetical protein [Stellaceae bacterium]
MPEDVMPAPESPSLTELAAPLKIDPAPAATPAASLPAPVPAAAAANTGDAVTLDDVYTKTEGTVFLNGIQALVRLPLVQIRRDRAAGLNTGGFIAGYRGSPLGGYDLALGKAQRHLAAHGIVFQPAVNEELAATALAGSQQLGLSPGARHDGVFGIWYGKGPGADRTGDAFKHGNAAGSSRLGGVLCVVG